MITWLVARLPAIAAWDKLMSWAVLSLSWALFSSGAASAACSFGRSDYDKITAGMQVGEVEAALGCRGSYEGYDESNGAKIEYYVWAVGSAYVSMRFRDGSLTYKVQHGLLQHG